MRFTERRKEIDINIMGYLRLTREIEETKDENQRELKRATAKQRERARDSQKLLE